MAAGEAHARAGSGVEKIDVLLPAPAGHKSVTMKFCRIPAGTFRMGARGRESDEQPVHQVEVPYDFWMAKHVVTQGQYAAVFEALGLEGLERPDRQSWEAHPSHFNNKPDHPVENVSWIDATLWCRALSAWLRENAPETLRPWLAGGEVVCGLPTEIEWEHACRAGTDTEYWCGDDDEDLRRVAWCDHDYESGSTRGVHEPISNEFPHTSPFGLVGVHGNVWEWCRDEYRQNRYGTHAAGRTASRDDHGDDFSNDRFRVIRGGSWVSTAGRCRSAYRGRVRPGVRFGRRGFRVCLVRGPGSVSSGGEAAAPGRGAQAEQAQQDKASGTRPQSSAAGEAEAARGARAGIHDADASGAGTAALAAAGRSPAAAADCPFFAASGPPALVVGSLSQPTTLKDPQRFRELDFSRFTSLRHLILWGLTDVEAITGLPPGLERLDVRGCTSLKALPTATLDHLETLDLGGCTGFETFPAGLKAPNLRWLYLDDCTGIDQGPAPKRSSHELNRLLEPAGSLEVLSAVNCEWLKDLECLPAQDPETAIPSTGDRRFPEKRLKKLVLRGCTNLTSLPDLSRFRWLHHLDLRGCSTLGEMPALPVGEEGDQPTGIRTLYVTGCENLKSFRGLDIRRVHRGEAIPTAGSEARDAAAVNVAEGFRTLWSLAGEPAEMRMAKVLFLGSGRCGKTTLAKALRWKMMSPAEREQAKNGELDPCPDKGQLSTPNIRLDTLQMPTTVAGKEVTTNVHVWDFGGQEIYHNTHRLFASEGAVFVIVTTTDTEHEQRLLADIRKGQTLGLPEQRFRDQNVYRGLSYWLDFVWEARGLRGASLAKGDPRAPKVIVVFTGDEPAGTKGGNGARELLKKQAGRYEHLVGGVIRVESARITQEAFDAAGSCVDEIHRLVSEAAAEVADELGVRVPGLYGAVERKCTRILEDNEARAKVQKSGKAPTTDKIEKHGSDQWTAFVIQTLADRGKSDRPPDAADGDPGNPRRFPRSPEWTKARDGFVHGQRANAPQSDRQHREISRALAAYLHECGRVFRLRHDGTVVIDQRWAVNLVYEVVVKAVANDGTRADIHLNTSTPFDSSWLKGFFHRIPEVTDHWDFLLSLLDACNIVVKVGDERRLAVDPELLGELDECAAGELTRSWHDAQPGGGHAPLVNHSFAIHDTAAGLVLGRHAFQRIAAAVGRSMHGPLPWLLHFGFDDDRWPDTWVRFHHGDAFRSTARFWRDGFQVAWTPADFLHANGREGPENRELERPGDLVLRMEWKALRDRGGGFRGGIFVQLLGSDEAAKSQRLQEFLFGRRDAAAGGADRTRDPDRRSPPLGEYRLDGNAADLVLSDHRPYGLSSEAARCLRGVGSPGWIHPDGPTNNARFDVAISYRRKASAEFVAALHAALKAAGLLSYYDLEQRMEGPSPVREGGQAANTLVAIYDTLRRARVLVVVPAVEYFATPQNDTTAAENIFCPVELAEAALAGTSADEKLPSRPASDHLWVRPAPQPGDSPHVIQGELVDKIPRLLDEMYRNVIYPRSAPGKHVVPAMVRENESVRRITSDERSSLLAWINACTYGSEQYVEIPPSAAGGWDFSRFVNRIEALLRGPVSPRGPSR